MCRLAVEGTPGIEVDLRALDREGPTFTIETLQSFPADEELFLILGSDSLAGLETWHRWEEILARVTLAEAPRPGVSKGMVASHGAVQLDVGLMEVSSTDIRDRVASGRPYRFLVTAPVFGYIEVTNLYAEPSEGDNV